MPYVFNKINHYNINGRHHDVLAKHIEELRSLYTSSTTKFYYIKSTCFDPINRS